LGHHNLPPGKKPIEGHLIPMISEMSQEESDPIQTEKNKTINLID